MLYQKSICSGEIARQIAKDGMERPVEISERSESKFLFFFFKKKREKKP